MKLVIDIDNEKYKIISDRVKAIRDEISKNGYANNDVVPIGWGSIADGTPLPKGYGNLIDKDKLLDELEKTVKSVDDTNKHFLSWDRAVAHVHLSKPIIKADGGKEDGDSN